MLCMGSDEAGMQVPVGNSTGEISWRTTLGTDHGRSLIPDKGIWASATGIKIIHVCFRKSILAEQGET